MDRFIRSVSKPCRRILSNVPEKLRISGGVLILMVFAELFLNYQAVSQLMDAGETGLSAFRAMVVALFVTVIVIALNYCGGHEAKLYYEQNADANAGPRNGADSRSKLVVAIAAPALSAVLIAVISFIRYSVGEDAAATFDQLALAVEGVGGTAFSAIDTTTAETALLATVLTAASAFAYAHAFLCTSSDDVEKETAVMLLEREIALMLTSAACENSSAFAAETSALLDDLGNASMARIKDQVLRSLMDLCDDPDITSRAYREILEAGNMPRANPPCLSTQAPSASIEVDPVR